MVLYLLFIGFSERPANTKKSACFKDDCFYVEIADSQTERIRGLMYRKTLNKDSGTLFVFEEEGIYPFWMKNTLIPLDIIWINKDKEIIFIKESAQPCKTNICPTTTSNKRAKYILEINAGLTEEMNIKIGDKIDLIY